MMVEILNDLQKALAIIVDEYPKDDERYIWAVEMAEVYEIDLGEG